MHAQLGLYLVYVSASSFVHWSGMQKINATQTCSGGFAHVLCMKFEKQKSS